MDQHQFTAEEAQSIFAIMAERNRLAALSNDELVNEALEQDISDHLIVLEMMNRVAPGWEKR